MAAAAGKNGQGEPPPQVYTGLRRRVPVIRQASFAECGHACLAMVAGYYGQNLSLAEIRRRHHIGTAGVTLKTLIEHAAALGLSSRALRLDPEHLAQLRLPAILHWDLNHFVVLTRLRRRGVVINDPAAGERSVGYKEFSKRFSGVALELTPNAEFRKRKKAPRLSLTSLFSLMVGVRRSFTEIVLLGFALQLLAMLLPIFLQVTIDRVLVTGDWDLLHTLAVAFGGFAILRIATEAVREWVVLILSTTLNLQLTSNVVRHLLRLPYGYFESRNIGDIQSRVQSLRQVQQVLTGGFVESLVDGIFAVVTLGLMVFYSPWLTLIVVISAIIYGISRFFLYRPLRNARMDLVVKQARSENLFLESLRAILPLKVFGRESDRHAHWLNERTEASNAEFRAGRLLVVFHLFAQATAGIEHIVVIWLGAQFVLDNDLSVGMLTAFLAYRQQFSSSFRQLLEKILEFQLLSVHLERVSDITLEQPEDIEAPMPRAQNEGITGRLELRDVGFRYTPDSPWLFRGVNLTLEPGRCLVIVGPTGSGKTTLMKVMMGLLEPTEGEILIDGMEIRRFGARRYRRLCAAVMQDDRLISGSILDNIAFASDLESLDVVVHCAELACVRGEIEAMPMRFETLVGDMGSALSGGQIQRIMLARALYAWPRILFLDEATSALDIETEHKLNENLRRLPMARVVISHRPGPQSWADQMVVLDRDDSVRITQEKETRRA